MSFRTGSGRSNCAALAKKPSQKSATRFSASAGSTAFKAATRSAGNGGTASPGRMSRKAWAMYPMLTDSRR